MSLLPPRDATTALIAVDLQVDFLPGGALAVPDGDHVVPLANRLGDTFETVVLTQDWHPPGHISFASSHPGKAPLELIDLPYGPQALWPDHCVRGTPGAELAPGLAIPKAQLVIRKGHHHHVDSYSTFTEADRTTPTGLTGYLRARGISNVVLMGLALDFCVAWSAVDAVAEGFTTYVIEDACRAIDTHGSLDKARADMSAAGVQVLSIASFMG
ncbi:nicotinamidase [Azorhizobium oxalatiphilum]|uniref:Nicotinamidase n=1 Tax=Azorhizobium oxalatiphilum TaxID=980631 RepID=A0A917BHS5_9HYPH|nr:bifunctional nicotinamidase/pyrazinamidase [Azorhizobium oxalatiphilum]GGF45107.1 nicotinamidase [Azorhizobium oxalatiphilum]